MQKEDFVLPKIRDKTKRNVQFFIPGKAVPKERPRVTIKNGRTWAFTPKRTVEWENTVRTVWDALVNVEKFTGPVVVDIAFYFYQKSYAPYVGRKDLDNLGKCILDALNGRAYKDDEQVVDLHYVKKFGASNLVEVSIEEANGHFSNRITVPVETHS